MKKVKTLTVTIIFWVLIIILSSTWLFFLMINNLRLAQINFLILLVLFVALLSFTLSMYFIYQIIFSIRIELKKVYEKEKNKRDINKCEQLLEPPSIFN